MFEHGFLSMFRRHLALTMIILVCAFNFWWPGSAGRIPLALAADFCSTPDSCGFGKVCSNGKCVESDGCVSRSEKKCLDNDVYWYDSCGAEGERFADCGNDTYTSEYQCSKSMVQQKVIARGCDGGKCLAITGWVDVRNCADSGNVCKNGACLADVVAPPILYYLSPSGTVTGPSATLSLTTNKAAECRYSYYDVSFDQMSSMFLTSDNIHHSVAATLSAAGAYGFYVRCRDTNGNTNLVSSKISFVYSPLAKDLSSSSNTGKTPADTVPPVISGSSLLPTGQIDTEIVQVALTTDEKAACRFDTVDTGYDSMKNNLTADGSGMVHRRSVKVPSPGAYVFKRASEGIGCFCIIIF